MIQFHEATYPLHSVTPCFLTMISYSPRSSLWVCGFKSGVGLNYYAVMSVQFVWSVFVSLIFGWQKYFNYFASKAHILWIQITCLIMHDVWRKVDELIISRALKWAEHWFRFYIVCSNTDPKVMRRVFPEAVHARQITYLGLKSEMIYDSTSMRLEAITQRPTIT